MRRQVVASVRAGESTARVAERLLDVGNPAVELPRHVRQLEKAARVALASGDRNVYLQAVDRWKGTIERLGSVASGDFSVRAATQQLASDLGELRVRPTRERGELRRAAVRAQASGDRAAFQEATRRLAADLQAAKAKQIDNIIDRWTLERARHQARTIARTETVDAYRDQYRRQGNEQPYVIGYRWVLSPRHPRADVCWSGSTMVEARGGARRIDSLRAGDEVLTHAGRYMPVTRVFRSSTPAEGLLRLRFQAGTSRVLEADGTRNHPCATGRGWQRADDLRGGDRGLALPEERCMRVGRLDDGNSGIDRSGSPQNAPCACQQTSDAERCAGPPVTLPSTRTWGTDRASIGIRNLGSGMRHFRQILRTSLDSLRRSCLATFPLAPLQASPTCPDGASRSWGFLLLGWQRPCTSSSRTDPSASSFSARTACRTSHTVPELAYALPCSTCRSRTSWPRRLASRIRRICSGAAAEHCRSTADCRSGAESSPFLRQIQTGWGASEPSSVGTPVGCRFLGASPILASGGEVFNLEVAEDHTYFAGGILVHNCDVLASQDLDGLGPGGYLPESVPDTPHPSDLCSQVAIMDSQYFRRQVAIAKGQPEPDKPWLSGKRETGQEWLAKQPEKTQRELLGPTRLDAMKRGEKVLNRDGTPIPVHKVTGGPKPTQKRGPAVAARPVVRRDRTKMVRPFPTVPR